MYKTARLQIPVTREERVQYQAAARKAGLPVAEWVRRILQEKAAEVLGSRKLTPPEALAVLFRQEAPVASVKQMIRESTRGRYS